jgi:ubiquinone/menaquinone biosynthesis C-methylase UbiE
MRVLDIGTGPGMIPLRLQRFYPSIRFLGLDVSVEMINTARIHCIKKKVPLELLAGDGEILPFRDDALHGVTSFFALHHMDRPQRLFKEIDRVLAPKGPLLLIDFRRDMSPPLFHVLDASWQLAFLASPGRYGFRNSVRSAWRAGEITEMLKRNEIQRFQVHTNRLELWITEK